MTIERDGWFGVEIRHLKALTAVAHAGSFTGGAEQLGYVQSAVSRQLQELEFLIEQRLVVRHRGAREISLTPCGEALLPYAEEILARLTAAQADLDTVSRSTGERRLRLGVFPWLAERLLPVVLERMATCSPGLRLEVVERGGDRELLELVRVGELDLALCEHPLPDGPFRSRLVAEASCVLLASAHATEDRLTNAPSVGDLAELPLVAVDGSRSAEALEAWFLAEGHAVEIVRVSGNASSTRAMVAAGLAMMVVPRLAVEPWDNRMMVFDLVDVVPERQVAVCWHSGRGYTGDLERVSETIVDTARELVEHNCNDHAVPDDRPAWRARLRAA